MLNALKLRRRRRSQLHWHCSPLQPAQLVLAIVALARCASNHKLCLGAGFAGRYFDVGGSDSDTVTDSTDDVSDISSDDGSSVGDMYGSISTLIVCTATMLSDMVRGLACVECHAESFAVRVIDKNLGLVCDMETYCTSCDHILNSTLSSERVVPSGNAPFVVTRHTVAAFVDSYRALAPMFRR